MAEELAGRLFIELLPDVDRKKFQAAVETSTKGVEVDIPVGLKLKPGAVTDLAKQANAQVKALKNPPKIAVGLKINRGAAAAAIREANAQFKALKAPPLLSVGLNVTATAAKAAIRDANVKLKAAKVAPPKLNVELNLNARELEAIKEIKLLTKKVQAEVLTDPIDLRVDLDEKSQKALLAKVALLKAKADAAGLASFERTQGRIRALEAAGLDQRSLINQRFENQRALIAERANTRISRSSGLTLRILRNDLSQFDQSTTRVLRRLGISFGIFSTVVIASFTAIATAATVQFAKVEAAATRASSIFASVDIAALDQAKVTAQQILSINREIRQDVIDTSREVAVATKFDTEQIAEGFRFLAGAGVDLKASLSAMPTVAKFAQAGFLELEDASELLAQGFIAQGGDVSKFGSEIEGLADKMTFVAQTAPITMEEALKAFANNSAASFAAFGQSAEEALNIIGLLGRTGVKGLTAGTQAAILVREISRSAFDKAPEVFKKYGIAVRDADGRARSFSKVLDEMTTVFREQTKDFTDPRAFTLLKKEFALTEKSSRAFQQVLPAVRQLQDSARGAAGELANLQEQATGRLAIQSQAVTDQLAFQFEQLVNNIQNLGSVFAEEAGRGMVGWLKEVNGELEGSTSLFDDLERTAKRFGGSFANVMQSALTQLSGPEGEDFFGGIVETYRGTLTGFRDLFREFRSAAFGEGSDRGFFSVLGAVFSAMGEFARNTLPRIGFALGTITKFVRENEVVVKTFIKTWLSAFVVSKVLRLIVLPAVSFGKILVGILKTSTAIVGLNLAASVQGWASSFNAAYNSAARFLGSLTKIAATQEAIAASQAVSGAAATSKFRNVGATGAGAGALALDPVMLKGMARWRSSLALIGAELRALLPRLVRVGAIVAVIAGAFVGFYQEMKRTASADREFKETLDALIPVLKTLGTIVLNVVGVVFDFGKTLGRLAATVLRDAIVAAGDLVSVLKELFSGNFTAAARALGDVIANTITAPFRLAASAVTDLLGDIIGVAKNIPGIGGWARDASEALRSASESARDFRVNMHSGEQATKSTKAAVDSLNSSLTITKNDIALANQVATNAALAANTAIARNIRLSTDAQFALRQQGFLAASAIENAANSQRNLNDALRIGEDARRREALAARANFEQFGVFAAQQVGQVQRVTFAQDMQARLEQTHAEQRRQRMAEFNRQQAHLNEAIRVGTEAARRNGVTIVDALNSGGAATVAFKVNFDSMASAAERDFIRIQLAAKDTTAYLHQINGALLASLGRTQDAFDSMIQGGVQDLLNSADPVLRQIGEQQLRGLGDQAAINAAREARRQAKVVADALGDALPSIDTGGAAEAAAAAAAAPIEAIKTASEQAAEAVNKLSQAQLNKQAAAAIAKVSKSAAGGYKATAREAEVLRRALPGVEAQLEGQTAAVAKLDEALQSLQSTQLKGTQAFNKQAFEFEQQIKQLQLQRLDLVIAGTSEEDAGIAALDAQISAIQQQAQRAQLAFEIDTAPLQKKLEELFNPVKELSFDQITAEFKKLGGQKAPLIEAIAGGENLKAALEATIKDADERFGNAGKQVTLGFVGGIKGQLPQVTQAGKLTGDAALAGVNNVMAFGSPSRTMIQRGVWVNEGFVTGINSTLPQVQRAGVDSMWGFLEGMRNVYENRVQPFVLQIAEWIKDNKGPIDYDRTLLRPAGQAMMEGFHGGLQDGFGEIKSWVKQVGPSISNHAFPEGLFFERSARFLINNAKFDSQFDAEDAFGDLTLPLLGGIGGGDPRLSFLHRSLSLADTKEMAQKLAGLFNMVVTSTLRAQDTDSWHSRGLAADLSNGSSPTPEMDALFKSLIPFSRGDDRIFNELIYKNVMFDNGNQIGYSKGDHFNHVHAAWMAGEGFSMLSGKKGVGQLSIPGVSAEVLAAIGHASQATKLDPRLIAAVMKQESGFRPNVVSPDGGYGLMQLTSQGLVSRADQLGGRFNPNINALVGSEYLRDLINQLGSVKLGLSAYNSGPGGGERFGRVDVPAYVASVLRFFEEFKRKFSGSGNYRAQGGNMNAGDVYHVNERGEELFIPGSNGTMISAKDFRSMVAAIQQGGVGQQAAPVYHDNRKIEVRSNANSAAVARALFDSRMRSQIVGVRR